MLDYNQLAIEFINKMMELNKARPFKALEDGLHGGQFVLQFICAQKEALPKEISDAMSVSSARVAAALNDLEAKGLISRQIDKDDRRKIIVTPTQNGRELAQEISQMVLIKTEELLSLLGESDAKEYVRITGRLAQLMKQIKDQSSAD